MEHSIDERFISHEEFSNHDCHNGPHDGCQICYDFNRQQESENVELDKSLDKSLAEALDSNKGFDDSFIERSWHSEEADVLYDKRREEADERDRDLSEDWTPLD